MKNFSYALIMLAMISSCSQPKEVDLIIYNAKIYTVDSAFSVQSAMAISNGKVESVDNDKAILSRYFSSKIINMNGGFVYPGFIDAHSHFVGYAEGLVSRADLVGTASFEEVLLRLQEFENQFPSQWLVGRGWDQNDWEKQEFPTKERLDELWPNKPVYLSRVDGHAALLNSKALQIAGITADCPNSYSGNSRIHKKKRSFRGRAQLFLQRFNKRLRCWIRICRYSIFRCPAERRSP
ncbi:MAG: hypothetical protein B7C24_03100 [Bacteroidetes bacterium 4572_77]|nr:MAG: hypothetical protein B7C24_03100 [Bacteroidetes bacterium 4572_77]